MPSSNFTGILFPAILISLSLGNSFVFLCISGLRLITLSKSRSVKPINKKHSLGVRYLNVPLPGIPLSKYKLPELGFLSCFVVIVRITLYCGLITFPGNTSCGFSSHISRLETVSLGVHSSASKRYFLML